MGILGLQINYLNVVAVIVIMAAIFRKNDSRAFQIFPAAVIISCSAAVHAADSGLTGILFVITGILVAALSNYSYLKCSRTTKREFMISIMIGAVVGPAGAFFIFLIVFMMNLVQGLLNAYTTSIRDRYATCLAHPGIMPGVEDPRSPIARIEARRLETAENGGTCADGDLHGNDTGTTSGSLVLPWSAKTALATLTVLVSGIFI